MYTTSIIWWQPQSPPRVSSVLFKFVLQTGAAERITQLIWVATPNHIFIDYIKQPPGLLNRHTLSRSTYRTIKPQWRYEKRVGEWDI